jgi:signal transduction histidine kinase
LGLAGAALALGLIDLPLILTSDYVPMRGLLAVVGLLVGWGFVGAGLLAWWRHPDNRVGMLMAATGFIWLVSLVGASDIPLLFTFGGAIASVYLATAVHMLLAAPEGRLRTRTERRIVAAIYVLTLMVIPMYLFVDPQVTLDCDECPENLLLVSENETVADAIGFALNAAGVALVITVMVILVQRWRRAAAPVRRIYGPLYAAGIALMVALVATLALSAAAWESEAADISWIVGMVVLALMPLIFLAAFVRARMLQGGAVGELIARLGEAPRPGELRDALADALGDPSLELVYWLPEDRRFVDVAGRPFELPKEGSGRALSAVERDGTTIAAIVYDAFLVGAQDHVRAVGAAAALALENERLDAELRAKLEELRASRERMLSVGLEERRRLERNLHDGAQQRLVALALDLRMARGKLREDPDSAEALLTGAGVELEAALEELRELARGLHPALLGERGLRRALETLALRAPVPVELSAVPAERLPEGVELAAYFVVSEALTNVAKYAAATRATVSVERDNGRVVVAVADDGVGGADPEQGTGLRGLADRIAVLEGRLEVESEPGRGTIVKASIPCG